MILIAYSFSFFFDSFISLFIYSFTHLFCYSFIHRKRRFLIFSKMYSFTRSIIICIHHSVYLYIFFYPRKTEFYFMLLATSKHTFFNSSLLLCNIQWCPQRMRMYTVRFLWTIFKTKVCNYIEIIIFFKLQVVFTVSSLWVTLKSIFHPFCFVMNRDII